MFAVPLLWLGHRIVSSWFLCDDAFISFRYARHLVEGHGLVFNPGERVEGFTNLLWVLEIAALWCLGLRPEWGAPLLSVALTLGTLWVVGAAASRLTGSHRPRTTAWMAVTLVATSQAFAEWSTSGLETRQFTFLVVFGVFALVRAAASSWWSLVASLLFAAAELTRPEGLLVFASAVGCFGVHVLAMRDVEGRSRRRRCVLVLLPFVVVVVGHFLWRSAYYGEWLPNTYHAKHVRAWYEAGFRYAAAATLELGMWVWLPLAACGLALERRDRLLRMLPFAVVLPHLAYLMHIGGDHFAFRPLDFYLPLTAPLAAAGLVRLAPHRRWLVPAFALVLAYAQAMGMAHDTVARRSVGRQQTAQLKVQISPAPPPWLPWLPGATTLASSLDGLRAFLCPHAVAAPVWEHAELGRELRAGYSPYEALPAATFGADTVTAIGAVGVMPFYLRDLRVVDTLGLTDAVVARNPSATDNAHRVIAHDRRPPAGYLRQRGANLFVQPHQTAAAEALVSGTFALRVEDGVWLPLLATDLALPPRRWPADLLIARHRVDVSIAGDNHVRMLGTTFTGTRLLATFEPGDAGLAWRTSGSAGVAPLPEQAYGAVGARVMTTWTGEGGELAAGHAVSGVFEPAADSVLVLFVLGDDTPGGAVRLHRGSTVLHTWSRFEAAHWAPQILPIGAFAGQQLHLEVQDGGAGWVAVDHVMLACDSGDAGAASMPWAPSGHATRRAFESLLSIEPLTRRRGLAVDCEVELTFRNAFSEAAQIVLSPAASSACVDLRIGAWMVDGRQATSIPVGAVARCRLSLEVREPVPAHESWFSLDVRVESCEGPEAGRSRFSATLALPWRDSD